MFIDKRNIRIKELKSICKGLGISCKGTKSELIERIENYNSYLEHDILNHSNETYELDEINNTTFLETEPESFNNDSQIDESSNNYLKNMETKYLMEEQDEEYNLALKADKLKTAESKFNSKEYEKLDTYELDLLAEKSDISFLNEPSKDFKLEVLIKLNIDFNKSVNENVEADYDDHEEDEVPLSKDELITARLRYFSL